MKSEAEKLSRRAKVAMKAAEALPEAEEMASQAETPKEAARLEDLSVWVMEKVKPTKKGNRYYHYWMATWRESGKVRNVHLGNCEKMDEETAKQKARAMKAAALAIKI